MSRAKVLEKLDKAQLKREEEQFRVGDTIRVHIRIIEGEKERVQVFTGTVIARKGKGASETFSVHRFAYGEGMERVFLLNSPRIAKIEVIKKGRVRRGKLYYLRGTSGKASKVKGQLAAYSKDNTNDNVAAPEVEIEQIENTAEVSGEPVKS